MSDISTTLKFVNLQVAAEALLQNAEGNAAEFSKALVKGNNHASRFPPALVQQYAEEYSVVRHRDNTNTGFSGTLFRNNTTGELILSFRSTEFVDDSLRDSKATGELEIAKLGWAIGQISDMEDFYAELKATGKIGPTDFFYVTGYSLGGHLATAFNLLRQEAGEAERIVHTYTFNGAGTGGLLRGAQLQSILSDFRAWRADPSSIPWSKFEPIERQYIEREARSRVNAIFAEEARLESLKNIAFNPRLAELKNRIAAKDINYQIAAVAATFRRTSPSSTFPLSLTGENLVPTSPVFAGSIIPNMTEVVGSDGGNLGPSFIANSGIHHGKRQTVYIEDQPLYRGTYDRQALWDAVQRRLLQDNYPANSFGDTHSIVLLVDSLTVMDVFARLAAHGSGFTQRHIETILGAASRAQASTTHGTQGKAEGDTLEKALDALRRLIVGPGVLATGTAEDLTGGTWAATAARNRFHENVLELNKKIETAKLAGKLTFTVTPDQSALKSGASLPGDAGAAWRYALVHLNPFVVHGDSTLLPQYANQKYAQNDSAHPDGLTDAYIQDRASFLAWKNQDFQANGKRTLRSTERLTYEYVDNTSGVRLTVHRRMYSPTARPVNVVFGNDAAEVIAGDNVSQVDHLYGGGGDDVLGGGPGNDYLEGNAGDDTLDGGEGVDVLVAGSGDDTLRGGTEIDTYIVGAGNDHVIDEDGLGVLIDSDGNRISGLLEKRGSQYVLAGDPQITATMGDALEITLANGATVTVADFDDGDLGLRLTGMPPEVVGATLTDLTNSHDFHVVFGPTTPWVRGWDGNDCIDVHDEYTGPNILIEGGAGGDLIAGSRGDDRLFGGTEADLQSVRTGVPSENNEPDALHGRGGDDLVVGGNSSDWLVGAGGADEIYGGAGNDLIAGGGDMYGSRFDPEAPRPFMRDTMIFNVDMGTLPALSDDTWAFYEQTGRVIRGGEWQLRDEDNQDAADTIYAGAGDDEVWAGWGNDYVSGDAGADTLIGEEGEDTLFGGEDADTIEGDGPASFGGPDSHGTDYIDGEGGDDKLFGWGAGDTIFGGAGADLLVGDDEALDPAYHGEDYLDGEEGDDVLSGQGGDDQLFGGAGKDELQGGDGNDYLNGEEDADTAFGGAGDDELYGGSGDDRLLGENGSDYIEGEGGADRLAGDSGDDTLMGGAGSDALYGESGADGLYGGVGDDLLEGGEGDDVLSGGAGVDTLKGGAGDDVYSFAAGEGIDTISDTEGTNTIRFTGTWSPASLKIAQTSAGTGFRFSHGFEGDAIVVTGGLAESVQQFEFANGVVKTLKEVLDLADADPIVDVGAEGASLYGGSNNDVLTAGAFSRIDGGRGDDTLTSTGDDVTFDFAAGDGHDVVRGGGDFTFDFDESVRRADLIASRMDTLDPAAVTPRDLLLQYGDADNPDTIAVADDARSPFRRYQFVDSSMSHSELLEQSGLGLHWLGTAEDEMVSGTRNADRLAGEGGRDTLQGGGGDDDLDGGAAADGLAGGAGNDMLLGASGNDTLDGGAGDDRYVFEAGHGFDVVVDNAGNNLIEFGSGISLSDIDAALASGNDGNLYLAVHYTSSDAVLIRQNFGDSAGDGTFTFRFSDGSELTSSELASREFDAPLDFRGSTEALRINGSRFDDVVIGSTRDDRIDGGAGNDRLAGDAGRDVLMGGTGDDVLVGNSGDDVLDGGVGRDVYRFHRGMGKDLVIDVAGEQSVLLLDADIARDDLAFERSGADLHVYLANSRDGVRIRGYFASTPESGAQPWQVQFGDESATPLAGLIGVLEPTVPPATIEALMAEFSIRARTHYESLLIANGYRRQSDGSLAHDEVLESDYYRSHTVTRVTFDYQSTFDDSAWIWSDAVSLDLLNSTHGSTSAAHTFQELGTAGATYVPVGAGRNVAGNGGRVVVFEGDPDDISLSNDQDTTVFMPGAVLGNNPFSGAPAPNLYGGGSFSFGSGTLRYTTRTVTRTQAENTYDYRMTLGALTAGTSDNEVLASPLAIVDGGAGDDRVNASGAIPLPDYGSADPTGAPGALLFGNAGNDRLTGSDGDDVLIGGRDNDTLFGGKGNDLYVVLDGDDFDEIVENGATMAGIERENVLRLPVGVTLDNLQQTLTHELAARRESTEPASENAVKSLYAFLTLTWGGTDGVRLAIPRADEGAALGIDYVEFADGSRIALADLVARIGGETDPHGANKALAGDGLIDGGPGDDTVHAQLPIGGPGRDTLIGADGNDELFGGEFHKRVLVSSARFGTLWDEGNTYRGGAGDDQLWATAGTDTFEFELGDGCDTVSDVQHDSLYLSYGGTLERLAPWLDAAANDPAHREALLSNTDTIRFGAGISSDDIEVVRTGNARNTDGRSDYLVLQHRNGTDAIRFANWYRLDYKGQPLHNQLGRVAFADGTSWDRQAIEAMAAGATRQIAPSDADDSMYGTPLDEVLLGGEGNDWLQSGAGNDIVDGGAGDDTYFFEPGDGVDVVRETGVGTFDVLQFGGSITPADISLGLGSLLIRIDGTDDAIHIEGFDREHALASGTIDRFDFGDGTSLTYSELLARGFDLDGTAVDDALAGTDVDDRLSGSFGNDSLSGGAGDDRLDGGADDDTLDGGEGNDVYHFGAGYGSDRIIDRSGVLDSIRLGAGIKADDVRVVRAGNGLRLSFAGITDTLSIEQEGAPSIEEIVFADGTTWDAAMLHSKIEGVPAPSAPVVLSPMADQIIAEDTLFAFQVPDATFSTSDSALTFSASMEDGAPLPEWLTFDPVTRTFEGTPLNDHVGDVDVTVTASVGDAGSASDTFRLSITNTNDRPAVEETLPAQWAQEDFPFTLAVPTGMFVDVDAGDVPTLDATLANGEPLPAWLHFDPVTSSLSGIPGNGDVGSLDVRITATDLHGEQVWSDFTLNVTNVNDSPVLANTLPDLRTVERQAFSFSVPAQTFLDLDAGDSLRYHATLSDGSALPGWLTFDSETGRFSGTPGEDDLATYRLRVTAFDPSGSSASDDFNLEVLPLPGKTVMGTARADELTGSPGADVMHGFAGNDKLFGLAGRDVMWGGAGNDRLDGGTGDDWLFGGAGNDTLAGDAGRDTLWGGEGNDALSGDAADDLIYGQTGNDKLFGGAGRDYLDGGHGNDELSGDAGEDFLRGGADNDALLGNAANDLLEAGSGNDLLDAGEGNDFMAGGAGTDTIKPGAGYDVIAFNRGDGHDTIHAGGGAEDTLSLGGAIRYSDLTLSKSGHDLVLNVASGDRITLKDWYASKTSRSLAKLQVMADGMRGFDSHDADPLLDKAVQTFDFQKLATAFDTARAANPKLGAWSVMPALRATRIGSSDTEAVGGAIAREYARHGTLDDVDARAALDAIAHPRFGSEAQAFASALPGQPTPDIPDVDKPKYPRPCDSDPLRRLASGLREGALDEWAEKLENAIEQWLDRTSWNDDARRAGHDAETRTSGELDFAAAWQRTRALLERHLHQERGASESDADGTLFMPMPGTAGAGQFRHDALGRVSGHHLKTLNGLEEGLKALVA